MKNRIRTRTIQWLSIVLPAAVAACGGAATETGTEAAPLAATAPRGTTNLMDVEPIYFLKGSVASFGAGPVTLSTGDQVRVDLAANSALSQHRTFVEEVSRAKSSLYGALETTEEFAETENALVLTARTHIVVKDPQGLRTASPRLANMRLTPERAPRLSDLPANQRAWFQNFKSQMLAKPAQHPLGAAARKGDEALWAAALSGQGDLTITTTARIPTRGLARQGRNVNAPTLNQAGKWDFALTEPKVTAGVPIAGDLLDVPEEPLWSGEGGEAKTVSEFVNGFTIDEAFDWEETWDFSIGYLTVGAGAWYAVGLRIPIPITGTITPSSIHQLGGSSDTASSYETKLSVDVIDADEGFYERAGMAPNDVQDGKEFVLNAGAYVHVRANLLGIVNVDRTLPDHPGFDLGENFRPPFDGCGTACGVNLWVPSNVTRTGVHLGPITGEARVGFNVSGDGEVDLAYESLDDGEVVRSTRGNGGRDRHELSFTTPENKEFSTDVAALPEPGEKRFGYRVSDVDYTWGVVVTPGVRGDIHVDGGWFFQFDYGIGPFWLDFAKIRLGDVHFSRHAGTRAKHEVQKGKKQWTIIQSETNPNAGANLDTTQLHGGTSNTTSGTSNTTTPSHTPTLSGSVPQIFHDGVDVSAAILDEEPPR